jgi:hypothetical protein
MNDDRRGGRGRDIVAGAPLLSQGAGTVSDTEASRKKTNKCFIFIHFRNVGVYREM